MHARLAAGEHPGTHLDALGAQHHRRRGRPRVADAAGRDDRQVDVLGHQRKQHHRGGGQQRLEAAALDALHHQRVHPASSALRAPFSDPTTWTTVMAASCSRAVNSAGSPAEVNTCRTPASASTSTMDGSRFQPWIIRLAPTGRSVSSRTRRRSARPSSVRVSMMPRPPASDTAAANSALAM